LQKTTQHLVGDKKQEKYNILTPTGGEHNIHLPTTNIKSPRPNDPKPVDIK